MKGFRFYMLEETGVPRENLYTKAGMGSANQIHIQQLASCIGERKVCEHSTNPPRIRVVCHPDTEQNPLPYWELNLEPTAP